MVENKYGVVDVNFLAHLPSQKNQAVRASDQPGRAVADPD